MNIEQKKMLFEAFETAEEYLPILSNGMSMVVVKVQEGNEKEGVNLFLQGSEGLEWFTTILLGIKTNLPDVLNKEFEGKLLETIIDETLEKITEGIHALDNADYVLFADLLEYEIIPLIQSWIKILPELSY